MAMVSAWELVPGEQGFPVVAAPGTTTAVHFVQQLQANSALAGPEAGEMMRKLTHRILTLQGWESVDDIREGVTEVMLTAAAVYCEVGAGYPKQFLRHLGTPEGPYTAKKPRVDDTRTVRDELNKGYKPMKFLAVMDANPTKLTNVIASSIVVPDGVFDGAFGLGHAIMLPHNHMLNRGQITEVVNRYVIWVLLELNVIAPTSTLLATLAADFQTKFPNIGKWGSSARTHIGVLRRGWRNRRSPPGGDKNQSYKGLTISADDMANSKFTREVAAAGFGVKVAPEKRSYLGLGLAVRATPLMGAGAQVDPQPLHPTPVPSPPLLPSDRARSSATAGREHPNPGLTADRRGRGEASIAHGRWANDQQGWQRRLVLRLRPERSPGRRHAGRRRHRRRHRRRQGRQGRQVQGPRQATQGRRRRAQGRPAENGQGHQGFQGPHGRILLQRARRQLLG